MKKLIVIAFILNIYTLFAQDKIPKFKLGITSAYGTYNYNDLKEINQLAMDGLPFDSKIVDDFQPGYFFGGYAQYKLLGRLWLGPSYHYRYAGSRLGQRDYSGTFSFDQYVHAHSIGVKTDFVLTGSDRGALNFQLDTGTSLTKWEIDSKLELGEENESQKESMDGISWYISPAISVNYMLIPNCILVGSVGYSFDLIKNYHYDTNKDLEIIKSPDWSGVILSVGLEFGL